MIQGMNVAQGNRDNEEAAEMNIPRAARDEERAVTSSSSEDGNDSDRSETRSTQMHSTNKNSSYTDHSRVPPEMDAVSALASQGSQAKDPAFPTKLHMILSNPNFQDIVAWLPHGRSFRYDLKRVRPTKNQSLPHF
jgi:negative regulator of genetic competence, sporulation and motility